MAGFSRPNTRKPTKRKSQMTYGMIIRAKVMACLRFGGMAVDAAHMLINMSIEKARVPQLVSEGAA